MQAVRACVPKGVVAVVAVNTCGIPQPPPRSNVLHTTLCTLLSFLLFAYTRTRMHSYARTQRTHARTHRKQVHYDRNEQAGNTTAVAVLPEIKSAVEEHLRCDELIGILKKEHRNTLNRDRTAVLIGGTKLKWLSLQSWWHRSTALPSS